MTQCKEKQPILTFVELKPSNQSIYVLPNYSSTIYCISNLLYAVYFIVASDYLWIEILHCFNISQQTRTTAPVSLLSFYSVNGLTSPVPKSNLKYRQTIIFTLKLFHCIKVCRLFVLLSEKYVPETFSVTFNYSLIKGIDEGRQIMKQHWYLVAISGTAASKHYKSPSESQYCMHVVIGRIKTQHCFP